MKYSVIVPCYNEASVIGRCLDAVNAARQGRSDVQLIVVDNGSTDATRDLALARCLHPDDQVLETPRLRISAVRNAGAKGARGHYLLFLDGDIEVPPEWLTILDAWFGQNRSDVLGFVDLAPDHAPWFARIWAERVLARRQATGEVDFLPGRNIDVSRDWFDRVGGFDASLITGEDKDLIMRLRKAGAKVMSDRSVKLIHHGYERTFREWMRKEYWRQHSHVDLLRQQGLSLRLLRFPLLAIAQVLLVLLALALLVIDPGVALGLLALSLLPSLAIALRCPAHRSRLQLLLQATLLYWVRFMVAGVSVARAAWESHTREKERGS